MPTSEKWEQILYTFLLGLRQLLNESNVIAFQKDATYTIIGIY